MIVIFLISTGSLADFSASTSLLLEDKVMFWGKRQVQEKQSLCGLLELVRKIVNLSILTLTCNGNSYSTFNRG